jgi:hypothetical protein
MARLSLPGRGSGWHAASRCRRQAGRTHHADPEGQRENQGHLARGRSQGNRQRQLHDRRPVRPDAYTFTRESAADRRETGPLYRFTTFHLYGTGFAAIALGLARGALDDFVALAATKIPKTKTFVLRDNAVIQSQVALAEAKLASSRSFLLQTLHETWDVAVRGEALSLPQRAALKLAGTYAVHQAKDVIDTVYHAAGATRSSRAIRSSAASATCTP